jgi:hypothetical protein
MNDLFSSVVTNGLKADIAEGGRLEALELHPSDFEWKQIKNLLTNYISALTANLKSRFSSSLPILEYRSLSSVGNRSCRLSNAQLRASCTEPKLILPFLNALLSEARIDNTWFKIANNCTKKSLKIPMG